MKQWLPFLVLLSGCGHLPLDLTAERPVVPPPVSLRPTFPMWDFQVEPVADLCTETYRVDRVRWRTYCDVLGRAIAVEGEIYLPLSPGPHPLILVSPILGGAEGGYLECRVFGSVAAGRGMASFFLYQDEKLLEAWESATGLERRMRSWVRTSIKCLDSLLARYPIDPQRLGSFGISLGGIRTTLLVAAEPRLRANITCLAGGGLGKIFRDSQETLVRRYLGRRQECTGAPGATLIADFEQNLVSDPLGHAGSIDPRRILFFLARLDNKVPVESGWDLYYALGRPECRLSPLGHYTSIFVLPWAIHHSFEFFDRRFEKSLSVHAHSTPAP